MRDKEKVREWEKVNEREKRKAEHIRNNFTTVTRMFIKGTI